MLGNILHMCLWLRTASSFAIPLHSLYVTDRIAHHSLRWLCLSTMRMKKERTSWYDLKGPFSRVVSTRFVILTCIIGNTGIEYLRRFSLPLTVVVSREQQQQARERLRACAVWLVVAWWLLMMAVSRRQSGPARQPVVSLTFFCQ